jgi:hypothetical protein
MNRERKRRDCDCEKPSIQGIFQPHPEKDMSAMLTDGERMKLRHSDRQ